MKFNERLRMLRKKSGLTQTELAEAAGSTMRSIQNYEAGKRYPQNIEIAKKLAAALGVTSGELLGEEGEIIVDAEKRGVMVSPAFAVCVNCLTEEFPIEKTELERSEFCRYRRHYAG